MLYSQLLFGAIDIMPQSMPELEGNNERLALYKQERWNCEAVPVHSYIEVKFVVLVFEKESLMKLLLPISTSYPLLLATYGSLNETCCPGEQSASQKKSRVRLPSNQLNFYQEANTIKSAVKLGLELSLADVALRLSHM